MGKHPKKKTRELDLYCIKIIDWEAPYSFSIGLHDRHNACPFQEQVTIIIAGEVLLPEKLAGTDLQIKMGASRGINRVLKNQGDYSDLKPEEVGVLTLCKEERVFLGGFPHDIFPFLSNVLLGEKYKYIIMHGDVLYRRKALIRSIHFAKEFLEDQWL